MNKIKRTIAGLCAVSLVMGLAACKSESDNNNPVKTDGTTASTAPAETKDLAEEDKDALKGAEDMLQENESEEPQVIKFLSNWDINPGEGQTISPALSLFQTKYNGTVEWIPSEWAARYDDLSTNVLGGTGVDFFSIEEDTLPKGAINGMFQPVDEYIDMDNVLWQGVKAGMDIYKFGGKHYALVTGIEANNIVYYNRQTIEENGFDDPWELFEAGEWNWDTFTSMLQEFVDADDEHVGLDGWWSELALYRSGGVPFIQTVGDDLVVNTNSPEIEKAQNFMLDLYKKGLVMDKSLYDWSTQEQFMGEGRELFIICGTWYIMNPPDNWNCKIPAENIGTVPIPNAADADHPAMDAKATGFCICKGAQNPSGVARYVECGLAVGNNDESREVSIKQFREEFQWPEDTIERYYKINELAAQYPVIDIAGGISADVESLTTSNQNKSVGLNAALHGVEWSQTREEIGATVEKLVAEVNEQLKTLN